MPDRNLDAHLFSLREGLAKKPDLKVSLRSVHDFSRCKMAEHSFEKNVRRRLNGLQYGGKAGNINTEMVHTGVHIQMDSNAVRGSQLFGGILQQFNMIPIPYRRR